MNVFGWVLLLAVGVAAVSDAVAVHRRQRIVTQLAEPAVLVLLLAWAWLAHADGTWSGRLLLLALALTLVGAVLQIDHRLTGDRVAPALAAHLLAGLALLGAVSASPALPAHWTGVVVVVLAAVVTAVAVLRRWLAVPAEDPRTRWLLTAYGLVVALVAAVAWARGHVLPGAGLTLLGVGVVLEGWGRLSRTPVWRSLPVAVVVADHVGLVLVTVGVVRPDLLA